MTLDKASLKIQIRYGERNFSTRNYANKWDLIMETDDLCTNQNLS